MRNTVAVFSTSAVSIEYYFLYLVYGVHYTYTYALDDTALGQCVEIYLLSLVSLSHLCI